MRTKCKQKTHMFYWHCPNKSTDLYSGLLFHTKLSCFVFAPIRVRHLLILQKIQNFNFNFNFVKGMRKNLDINHTSLSSFYDPIFEKCFPTYLELHSDTLLRITSRTTQETFILHIFTYKYMHCSFNWNNQPSIIVCKQLHNIENTNKKIALSTIWKLGDLFFFVFSKQM